MENHSPTSENIFYTIALTMVPGIGVKTGKALLEHFGSAKAIFYASPAELKTILNNSVNLAPIADGTVLKLAEEEMEFIEINNIQPLLITHQYPRRLATCSDAPLVLYHKGNANLDAQRVVAIVGTRSYSDYGQRLCEELIEGLQSVADVLIVSGLALGIDAIAHKKAVQLGMPTTGVLGHGLQTIYPYNNKALAEQMMENGSLLSEFPSGTKPDRGNFPMRNRIVAGMSDVTVVVESKISGGALITAAMASGYNREVAAFPGRVNDTKSAGCNELIRTNIAAMITQPADLVELMNWDKGRRSKPLQTQLFANLSPEEQRIADILKTKDSLHADELLYASGMPMSSLAATLLQMEMQGIVKALPGKQYRLY